MKRTGKILVALLAVLVLLMSMTVLTASAATGQPEKLYLTPNANWKQSNARFAAYFFGNGEKWVSMTDADKDGVYEVKVPTDKKYPKVIFCRMNPSASANNWNNKWNQTADLTIPTSGANHYTVKEGTWDKGGGTWSTFGSTCAHTNLGPAATCTTPQVCQDCKDPVVAALGHNYNTSHLCTRCNTQAPFTVAGSAALCGSDWSTTDTKNDMTFADGVYTKVYENVKAGTYKFKVARDHDWGTAYPSADKSFKVDVEGSTVIITLKGTVVTVTVELPVTECPHENRGPEATCTEPQMCLDCEEIVAPATGHPGFDAKHMCTVCGEPAPFTVAGTGAHLGAEWDVANTANDMTFADGVWTKVYENVKAGSYMLKVARNHGWDVAYPGEDKAYTVAEDGSIVVITFNGSAVDVTVSVPHVCEYTEPATCLKGQHCKCGLVDPENPELGDHVYANGICSVCGELDLEDTVVIYFENNWAWPTVHFFYWYGENGTNAAWPGVDLKNPVAKTVEGHDVYMIEVPVGVKGIIFSGDGQYGAEQCNDITELKNCNYYYMTWDEATQSKPAGVKEYHSVVFVDCVTSVTCSVCGKSIEAPGHDMVVDKAVAPTCTETGLTEGSHCSRCDHKVAQEEVPALGHRIENVPQVKPNCTESGRTGYQECVREGCDYETPAAQLPALGHDMVTDKAVAPTCTETGLTEGSHCSRCDHKVAQESVPALGHDMVTDKAVAPTCTATGLTEGSHCSRCDHKVAQESVPALGHAWGEWIVDVEPTEEEDGVKHRVCGTCGETETGVVPSLGHTHNYNSEVTTAPTCTAEGVKTFTCRCGDTYTEAVASLGHDMVVDKAVAPTCTETGLTEGSHCSRCDHKVAQEEVPALGHDMVVDKAVAPTCTTTGLTEGSHCTRCDHAVAQEEVPALGHDMVTDKAVAPTCTTTGLTEGSHCSRCDYKVAQEEVPATGHNFVDGKCECGEEDPNYVPPHEHEFVNGKCECGEEDPNYVAPEQPDEDKPEQPGEDKPEQPAPSFFQRIWATIANFLKSIGDFLANIFKGKK